MNEWLAPNNTNATTLNGIRYPPCNTVNFTTPTVNATQTVTGCKINVQGVTVTNGAKLTLDAEHGTTIVKDFEVQVGSQLEIK